MNVVSKSINQYAPVKTRQTIGINVPVERVWKVFSDVDNWKSWQQDISSSRINGSFEVGSSFDWKSGGVSIHSTLHTVEPFKVAGWWGNAIGTSAIHNWYFEEQNGSTTVTVEESMEGWLVRLLKKYFQSKLDTSTQRWLAYLKAQSENVKQ